jgi:hypothetical protein
MATLKSSHLFGQPQARSAQSNCCAPLPPCPACGGLQCLCRPRFFAGQILTEDDLNRLEQYVIDKNRLHNRYLHGTGVVCGLVVSCNPCSDRVQVSSGYAISPCGDDIIVCSDDTAPICDLIRQCRPAANPFGDCTHQGANRMNDCQGLTEDWILAICYNETTARGVTPLRNYGSAGKSRCSCGSSSAGGCNCGCGGKKPSNGQNCGTSSPSTPPPPCQPTVTCEGYTFTVYKAPPQTDATDPRKVSRLPNLVSNCILNLTKDRPPIPTGDNATPANLQRWCCALKQWLRNLLATQAPGRCDLFDQLAAIQCPDPNQFDGTQLYLIALTDTVVAVATILRYLLLDCLCNSLLPQCPPPADCNCVPLATLKVRSSDCKVLEVCNWRARQLVLTFPDILAWLEPTGIFENLRKGIERICCGTFERSQFSLKGTTETASNPSATTNKGITPFAAFLGQTWLNENRETDAQTLALAFLGAADLKGQPLASSFELANPLAFLAVNQIVRPTLEAILPTAWTESLAQLGTRQSQTTPASVATADDLATLKQAIDELRTKVQAQADEIAKLRTP